MPLHRSHTNELLATNATYRYHFGLGRRISTIYGFRGGQGRTHDCWTTTFHHLYLQKRKIPMALKENFQCCKSRLGKLCSAMLPAGAPEFIEPAALNHHLRFQAHTSASANPAGLGWRSQCKCLLLLEKVRLEENWRTKLAVPAASSSALWETKWHNNLSS